MKKSKQRKTQRHHQPANWSSSWSYPMIAEPHQTELYSSMQNWPCSLLRIRYYSNLVNLALLSTFPLRKCPLSYLRCLKLHATAQSFGRIPQYYLIFGWIVLHSKIFCQFWFQHGQKLRLFWPRKNTSSSECFVCKVNNGSFQITNFLPCFTFVGYWEEKCLHFLRLKIQPPN